jgi:hypothetical protein
MNNNFTKKYPIFDFVRNVIISLIFLFLFEFLLFPVLNIFIVFLILGSLVFILLSFYYILIPLYTISKKYEINFVDILEDFIIEYQNKTRLGKIKIAFTIALGIANIISLILSVILFLL